MSGTNLPDNKLRNLHHALQLNDQAQPELRVGARITNEDPIPVALGTETVTITGDVVLPAVIKVENADDTTLAVSDGGMSLTVDGNVGVTILDSAINSAFGRLRTANTRLLGEFRHKYGTLGPVEILTRFANGGSQTINLAQAHSTVNVTTVNGSRALRQSRRYHSYIPGTTNLAYISFKLSSAKANLQQMVGLFDDADGIFFRMNGLTPEMVIRKAGVDTEVVPQANWNQDRLDGTGPSARTISWDHAQIFALDY